MNTNYKNIYALVFSLFIALILPIHAEAKHFLQINNNEEFKRFASSLPKHLINRNIIKSENSWNITSNEAIRKEEIGLILFNYLDYSFILSEIANPSKEARYFAQGSYTNLKLTENSFTLNRGSDIFHAEVIAQLNWDNKAKEDWLVFFSLTNPHSELVGRYFYLVITNPNIKELPLQQEIIASQNNLLNKFSIYIDEMPEYIIQERIEANKKRDEEAQKQALKDAQSNNKTVEEVPQTVLELDRGQYSILESPNSVPVEEKKPFWQRKTQEKEIAPSASETKLNN